MQTASEDIVDEELFLKNLKAGDRDSFKKLVEEHQRIVFGLCFHFLHNKEDAEDAAQEVFLEVFRSIKKFKGDSKLSTWIFTIASSKCIDFIRRKNRKKRFGSIKKIFSTEENKDLVDRSSFSSSLEKFEMEERKKIFYVAMDHISESQRVAITLSKIDGLKNKEVAEIMGTSVSAVESHIFKGKQKLKEYLLKNYNKYF